MPISEHQEFHADFDASKQIINIKNIKSLSEQNQQSLVDRFNEFGFVILRCEDAAESRADLCALKNLLGESTPHPRADQDGIVSIDPSDQAIGFIGASNSEHLLHTDGAYSDKPEKIISLQCVFATKTGGDTILASAKSAFRSLSSSLPRDIHTLFDGDALLVERKGQSSRNSVFRLNADGRIALKFRMSDGSACVTPSATARKAYLALCAFFENRNHQIQFRLEQQDILIADNTAIVHGRTAFPSDEKRTMRRLNFDASGPLCANLSLGFVAP